MVRNNKVFDWLSMAEDDLRDAWRDFEAGSYASSVYHAELSCQKVLKALITALGHEPMKTHKPPIQLKMIISMGILEEKKNLQEEILSILPYAITLEDQGTIPRYGWQTLNKIIKPSEIYDKEKAGALIDNAEHVLRKIKEIIGGIDC
jgi:HEPN domain-containing protein